MLCAKFHCVKLCVQIAQQQTQHNSNIVQWAIHLWELAELDHGNIQLSSVLDKIIF